MGDPKKLKKKYSTPVHPWNKADIEESKGYRREFGLRNRTEVLIAESFLKKYKNIAKRLIAQTSKQGEVEKAQMMDKLSRLGLLVAGSELDNVLSLEVKDVLNRRIQSIVFRKGLSRTMKQARQFIVHRHVTLDGKDVTSPGVLLSVEDEAKLRFKSRSNLAAEDHPERVIVKEVPEEVEETKSEKEEKVEEKAEVKKDTKKTEKKEAKPKKEEKVEAKEEVKAEAKEPVKEEAKETVKAEVKEDVKEEVKEEVAKE